MKIVVIGGSGLIGSKMVNGLRLLGHDVTAASPASGVNTITGEGLDEAMQNTQVVVDVANSPSFEDNAVMDFFRVSGNNLLKAEAKAGVRHHIALSVVGTDRLQESGYFRAKQVQEDLIKASGIPYTIVHSTQFFEFAGSIIHAASEGDEIHLSSALIQPISSGDVAKAMINVTINQPLNATVEIAGPESFHLNDLIDLYLKVNNDPKTVIEDDSARYFGALLKERTLLPGDRAMPGKEHFEEWAKNTLVKS